MKNKLIGILFLAMLLIAPIFSSQAFAAESANDGSKATAFIVDDDTEESTDESSTEESSTEESTSTEQTSSKEEQTSSTTKPTTNKKQNEAYVKSGMESSFWLITIGAVLIAFITGLWYGRTTAISKLDETKN